MRELLEEVWIVILQDILKRSRIYNACVKAVNWSE